MIRGITVAIGLLAISSSAQAQSLTRLAHPHPSFSVFQLTDGTVLAQGRAVRDFWILTPDNTGSYQNGTWRQVASLPKDYSPGGFASGVLADGRVLLEGAEYNLGKFVLSNKGEIYDATRDRWTNVKPPTGWGFIGDAPGTVLPNGHFLLGEKINKREAELDPMTMTWTEVSHAGKADFNAEEGWTLLPNGTVLSVDVLNHPHSESYDATKGQWRSEGSTPVDLQRGGGGGCVKYGKKHQRCYYPPGEMGPAILLPNGSVFAIGARRQPENIAHTAIFTPGTKGKKGTWTAGPDFPAGEDIGDYFATLLPNGHVLVEGETQTLYEFDGSTLTAGPNCGDYDPLLILPSGEVLVGGVYVYSSPGNYQSSWSPTIQSFPATVTRGQSYQISGTQFNGLSQANSNGDEYQSATNYPLIRITNNASGHVFYARTHDHSTMAVASGSLTVSTNFDVSSATETGPSALVVVANGIPSLPVSITVN